ncbi:MAG: EAL domain-containing protein [Lachnospiraceae bacterium]|nr:EAL domain-containing protein [Lachnospiraceae bacterium]
MQEEQPAMSLEAVLIGFVALFVLVAVYTVLLFRNYSEPQESLLLRPAGVESFGHGFIDAYTGKALEAQIIMLDRGETFSLQKTMPEGMADDLKLSMLSEGVRLQVYSDDRLIYASGTDDAEIMGREPGRIVDMIDLSDVPAGADLCLTFTCYKRHGTINLGSMYTGSEASLLLHALWRNIPTVFGCTFALFLGLMLVGYGLYFRIKRTPYAGEVMLIGTFSLLIALWASMDATLFQLFTDKLAIRYQMHFYLLSVLFVPFVIMYKNRCRGKVAPLIVLNFSFVATLLLNTVLYAFGIMPLSDSVYFTYALWIILWILCFITTLKEKRLYGNDSLRIPFLAYSYIILAALSDFVLYELRLTDKDSLLFKIVLILFLMLFSVSIFRANFTSLREKQFVAYYKNMAFTDPVTEGHSINWFTENATNSLKRGRDFAVVYYDLTHFKMVNDTIGRRGGDKMLKEIYAVVDQALQPAESMCHAGDAHFLMLLHETDRARIKERLQKMMEAMNQVPMGGMEHNRIGVIAGVYQAGEEELSVPRMIDRAIMARNEMRIEVINGFGCAFFTPAILDKLRREDDLKNRMLDGMKAGEFQIYLQPKVDPQTGKVEGAEALARWLDPIEGLISPVEFIPVFENNGSIISMNLFMLRGTIKIINNWLKEGIKPVTVSVNLSRVSIYNPLFMDAFTVIMKEPETPVSYLEFEFTENVVYESAEQMNELVNKIHGFGSTCSIDDFGCSYSNLTMLKDIPVDVLKLDQDFLKQHAAGAEDRSMTIVESIISMAHELNMTVVVEGVENEEQADFLKGCGCDMIQGYYYARPLPVAEFEQYLAGRNP